MGKTGTYAAASDPDGTEEVTVKQGTATRRLTLSRLMGTPVIADGAVTPRTLSERFGRVLDLADFGAAGNGTTNDSDEVQAAINAVPDGGTLFLPRGTCLIGPDPVGDGVDSIFTRVDGRRIKMIGEGYASVLSVHASTPDDVDVFRFDWSTSTRGLRFEDFAILPQSGRPGRSGIVFDFGTDNTLVYQVIFRNLLIFLNNYKGQAIEIDTPTGSLTGGMAYSVIEECLLDSIRLNGVGDNFMVSHNTIIPADPTRPNPPFPAVYLNTIQGAHNLDFVYNVIAGFDLVHVAATRQMNISYNWFENSFALANVSASNAMLVLKGDVRTCERVNVVGNTFASHVTPGGPHAIYVDDAYQVWIDGNTDQEDYDTDSIVLTSNAEDCAIGVNMYTLSTGTTQWNKISDSGLRTQYVAFGYVESWTPDLTFGGVNTGIAYTSRVASATKRGKVVDFDMKSVLSSKGSASGNILIFGLPYDAVADTVVQVELQSVTSGVGDTMLTAQVVAGSGTILVRKMVSGTMTPLTDADFTGSTTIRIAGSYITNDG